MQLIKCHIENFGKLHNFDHEFGKGMNVFIEENGWGKTTLAVFIKAMFYGLPSSKVTNIDDNERKKYTPWDNGKFGGSIDFEIKDKRYRLTRFFEKKESEDFFEFRDLDTGKISNKYSKNIGQEIFEIDSEGFERSCFIPQKILSDKPNESLTNKLNNLIHGTIDRTSCNDALEILKKRQSELSKNSGEIKLIENKLDMCNREIDELKTLNNAVSDLSNLIKDDEKEINSLKLEQNKIFEQINLLDKIEKQKANLDSLKRQENICNSIKSRIEECNKVINGANVTKENIERYISLQKELDKLLVQSEMWGDDYTINEYNRLVKYFKNEDSVPSIEEYKKYQNMYDSYKSTNSRNRTKNINLLSIIFVAIAVVMIIAGGIIIGNNLSIGVLLCVLGFGMIIAGVVVYLRNYIELKTNNNNDAKGYNSIINFNDIKKFIENFDEYEKDINIALRNIYDNILSFNKISNIIKEQNNKREEIQNKINKLEIELNNFLNDFNLEQNLSKEQKLLKLKEIINEKNTLILDLKSAEEYLAELKSSTNDDLRNNENIVMNFDIKSLHDKQNLLQNKIDDCLQNKTRKQEKIAIFEEKLSELNDKETERDELILKKKELKIELDTIKKASEYIKIANESLSSKYLKPMTDAFNKYFAKIAGDKVKTINMDIDLNMRLEEGGLNRDIQYLSKGYRNTIDLCLRFALIDTLFINEKPFIVLDDPFVNMDEEKISHSKMLLDNFAKNYQVIYFTCHKSRV